MTERWPSPIQSPAWHAYRVACDHIERQTLQQVPDEVLAVIVRTPDVVAVHDYVCRLARWGDVAKTQTAAQVWLSVVKQALRQCQEEVAA